MPLPSAIRFGAVRRYLRVTRRGKASWSPPVANRSPPPDRGAPPNIKAFVDRWRRKYG